MFNDRLKGRKSGLPILSARRSIPTAAFGLKKYFDGTSSVSMTPNKEDSLAGLWDAEVAAVKHTPSKTVPELGQRPEYKPEISSVVRAEKTRHVLDDKNSGAALSNQSSKLEKEARLRPLEPVALSHSSKRDVLAREACDPDFCGWDVVGIELLYVFGFRDSGEVPVEDDAAEVFDLALERDLVPRALKAEVEAADAGEQRRDGVSSCDVQVHASVAIAGN